MKGMPQSPSFVVRLKGSTLRIVQYIFHLLCSSLLRYFVKEELSILCFYVMQFEKMVGYLSSPMQFTAIRSMKKLKI